MIYRVLLEFVIAAHFAFIVFIVFGALLSLRYRWTILLHLPALCYGLAVELLNIKCRLAILENWLRDASFDSGYAQGFIEPYLIGLIYPPNWNPSFGYFLGFLLLIFNLFVYSLVFLRRQKRFA